jgi:hypothetical protein
LFTRYFVRVTITRRLSDIVKEKEIAVHTLSSYPELNDRCAPVVSAAHPNLVLSTPSP